jgi:hypothetical protein
MKHNCGTTFAELSNIDNIRELLDREQILTSGGRRPGASKITCEAVFKGRNGTYTKIMKFKSLNGQGARRVQRNPKFVKFNYCTSSFDPPR